jgi:group I intron endonuclease
MGYLYKATSRTTGKSYIGYTSKTLEWRKRYHKYYVHKYNAHFQHAIIKYGFDDFQWSIICESNNIELLKYLEKRLIEKFNLIEDGYNSTSGGDGVTNPSIETRQKQRMGRLGYKASLETKKKQSLAKIGHKLCVGRKASDITRKKMSEAANRRWQNLESRQKAAMNTKQWFINHPEARIAASIKASGPRKIKCHLLNLPNNVIKN